MKQILVNEDGYEYGPFTTITQNDVGYVCDNEVYQTNITGTVTVSEVADDYVNPVVYNAHQKEKRAKAYFLKSIMHECLTIINCPEKVFEFNNISHQSNKCVL